MQKLNKDQIATVSGGVLHNCVCTIAVQDIDTTIYTGVAAGMKSDEACIDLCCRISKPASDIYPNGWYRSENDFVTGMGKSNQGVCA